MYGHPSKQPLHALVFDPRVAVASCSFGLTTDGEIQLMPAGRFRARDGRPFDADSWVLDDSNAPALLATLAARQDRIVIDYEHQTLYTADNGKPAPAAGWFRGEDVVYRPGLGLFVRPEWTDAARAAIDAGEYAYFSPVIKYRPRTGEVLDVLMGALTNFAAIDGMQQIERRAEQLFAASATHDGLSSDSGSGLAFSETKVAWSSEFTEPTAQLRTATEEKPMLKQIIRALGLDENTTEEAALAAIEELKSRSDQADEAIAAARAETPAETLDAMKALQMELASLKADLHRKEVDDLVEAALSDGRLVPAMEEWARQLGEHNIESLKSYLDKAAPVAPLTGNQTGGTPPEGEDSAALDDAAQAVCKQLGISPEEYLKTLKEDE